MCTSRFHPSQNHARTVSDVVVETLTNWGLTHVFGMVGHSNLGFADAMRKAEARGDLTYIGIRHEGAAAFAASAYGKLTGRVAGCFGIAGPGSTNLLTGLYDAKEDRAPVLAISAVRCRRRCAAAAPSRTSTSRRPSPTWPSSASRCTPTPTTPNSPALAMKTAIVGRDVAHLVFPDEVQHMPVADDTPAGSPDGRTGSRAISPDPDRPASGPVG